MTLALAGLFSGLAIVGIYEVTLPRITANKAAALKRAVFEVVPGSERMERMVWVDGQLVNEKNEEVVPAIYAAFDADDALTGYAIPADGPGFQDNIKLIYGFNPAERRVVGMSVLESRETPGLGDKIEKDPDFLANFEALDVALTEDGQGLRNVIEPVKHGAKEHPWQIDGITGATISSKAIAKIFK